MQMAAENNKISGGGGGGTNVVFSRLILIIIYLLLWVGHLLILDVLRLSNYESFLMIFISFLIATDATDHNRK